MPLYVHPSEVRGSKEASPFGRLKDDGLWRCGKSLVVSTEMIVFYWLK